MNIITPKTCDDCVHKGNQKFPKDSFCFAIRKNPSNIICEWFKPKEFMELVDENT